MSVQFFKRRYSSTKVKYFRFDGNMKMSFFMRKSYYATIKNNNLQKNDKLKLLNLCIEKLNFMKGYKL